MFASDLYSWNHGKRLVKWMQVKRVKKSCLSTMAIVLDYTTDADTANHRMMLLSGTIMRFISIWLASPLLSSTQAGLQISCKHAVPSIGTKPASDNTALAQKVHKCVCPERTEVLVLLHKHKVFTEGAGMCHHIQNIANNFYIGYFITFFLASVHQIFGVQNPQVLEIVGVC